MHVEHLFASIPVADRDHAVVWYERFIGRAPDLVPNEREAAWQLTPAGWMYVIADRARAGSALHTLLVDDLNGCLAALAHRGVASGPIETIGESVRQAVVTDPDGNRLSSARCGPEGVAPRVS